MRGDAQHIDATGTIRTPVFSLATYFGVARRSAYIAQGDNMPVRFTLSPPRVPRIIARTAVASLTATLITACATDQPAPTGLNASVISQWRSFRH
jgi:hypothetical protein